MRFVQLFTKNQYWDHHGSIQSRLPASCKKVDVPAAALQRLEDRYDRRAVERRRTRRMAPGLFDERDLPVSQRFVDAVAATGSNNPRTTASGVQSGPWRTVSLGCQ